MIPTELRDTVRNLTANSEFTTSPPEEREKLLALIGEDYYEANPDSDPDSIKQYLGSVNQSIRRASNEGRKVQDLSQLNIKLPSQDRNWSIWSEDEKLEKIDEFRAKRDELKKLDPLNEDDLAYQIDKTADQMQRYAQGEDTSWAGDKGRRMVAGFAAGLSNYVGADTVASDINLWFETNPTMDEDYLSKLAQGVGDFGASTAIFIGTTLIASGLGASAAVASRFGTGAILAGNTISRYHDGYNQAIDIGLTKAQADDAGWAAIPGAVIDVLGDRLLAGRAGKMLPGGWKNAFITKNTVESRKVLQQMAKDTTLRREMMLMARDSLAEGASEALGDYSAGYGSYLATGERQFVPTQSQLTDSFTIGAILGGAVGGVSAIRATETTLVGEGDQVKKRRVSKEGQKYKAIEANLTEADSKEYYARKKFSDDVFAKLREGDVEAALELSRNALNLPSQSEMDNGQSLLPLGEETKSVNPLKELGVNGVLDGEAYDKLFEKVNARQNEGGAAYSDIYQEAYGFEMDAEDAAEINKLGKAVDFLAARRRKLAKEGKSTDEIEKSMDRVATKMNEVANKSHDVWRKQSNDQLDTLVTKFGVYEDQEVVKNKVAELNKNTKKFRYGYNQNQDGQYEIYRQTKPTEDLGQVMGRAADVNAAFNHSAYVQEFMTAAEAVSQEQSTADFHASAIDAQLGIGTVSDQTKFYREQQAAQGVEITPEEALAYVNKNQARGNASVESQHTGSTLVGSSPDWNTANDIRQSFIAKGEIVSIRENTDNGEYDIYTEQFKDRTPTIKSAEESAKAIQEETPKSASQSAAVIQRYYEAKASDEELGTEVESQLTNREKTQANRNPKGFAKGEILLPSAKDLADIGTNIKEVAQTAAAAFNSGLQNFASWSKALISKFGEGIRNFLKGIWQSLGDGLIRYMEKTGVMIPAINWDIKGIGSIPNQTQLDYFGFEMPMTPAQFMSLVPFDINNKTQEFMREKEKTGEAVAPPFLLVDWDDKQKAWKVTSHEGRNRSILSNQIDPDTTMPVSIMPYGLRAKNITDEMRNAPFIPERGGDPIHIGQLNIKSPQETEQSNDKIPVIYGVYLTTQKRKFTNFNDAAKTAKRHGRKVEIIYSDGTKELVNPDVGQQPNETRQLNADRNILERINNCLNG